MRSVGLTLVPRKMQPLVCLTILTVVWSLARGFPDREVGRAPSESSGTVSSVGVDRLAECPDPPVHTQHDGETAVPLWGLAAPGRPCVVLFISPGCHACYAQIDQLDQLRVAAAGSADTLLVFSSPWPYRELRRAGLRILRDHPYGGPVAFDPGRTAAAALSDTPPVSPFLCIVDEDRRMLEVSRGHFPETGRTLALVEGLVSPAAARLALGSRLVPGPGGQTLLASLEWLTAPPAGAGHRATVLLVGMELSPSASHTVLEGASLAASGEFAVCLVAGESDLTSDAHGHSALRGIGDAFALPVAADQQGRAVDLATRASDGGPWIVALPPEGAPTAPALVQRVAGLEDAEEAWLLLELWRRGLGAGEH